MRALTEYRAVTSLAWVVMPDHIHWLLQLDDSLSLPSVLKAFKARSAHRVNANLVPEQKPRFLFPNSGL
ncbi:transposase [Thiocapsa sp. C2-2m]|uniref:transposase n=1 Tax=Thiocapsa sp. C2-2m TaxID=3137395 RepID=UPI0035B080FA